MDSSPKIIRTIFVVIVKIMGFARLLGNTQQQLANALDFEISDFKCITAVGNIGNNICSENNSVTTNVDNSTTIDDKNEENCSAIIAQEIAQAIANSTNATESGSQSATVEFCNNIALGEAQD